MSYSIIGLDRRKTIGGVKKITWEKVKNNTLIPFGKKLKTQQDLAEKLNVSRQTYNTYENNLSVLSLDQIQEILIALEANDEEIKEFFYEIQQDILSHK